MTHHQCGISRLLPQISFHGETSVGFFLRLQVCLLHLLPSLEWDGLHSIVFSPFYIFFFVREEVKEMMNKRKTGSETLAAFEEHLNEVTFSNLRKQATFHDTFNSLPGKWHPGLEFLCLFLRCHFMGKLLVALQNVGCFFFFRTDFQWLLGLKKTCFTLSIWQAALKFSSPRAVAYFLKHFLCVCWWLSRPLARCMDKGALELFFLRSKIFFLSVGWNVLKLWACFQ